MIGAVRAWITSVAAVTLLLSAVRLLAPEGTLRKISDFTGGLLLLLALLQPLLRLQPGQLRLDFSDYEAGVQERTAELEAAGKEELAAIIAERTAAYISDKADALGLTVTVRVAVEPGEEGVPLPVSAELAGPRSQALADWMAETLGIPEERQVWHESEA